MLYFPQLLSGATAQYPIQKRSIKRTIVNQTPGGRVVKFSDSGAAYQEWQLAYHDLDDSDVAVFQQFIMACEGQLNGFTFLDPTGNLLAWSGAMEQPVWEASSLLQITSTGIDDPLGGLAAARITNPTGLDLAIQQTINAAGWFTYCFSVYVRGQVGLSITVSLTTGTALVNRAYVAQTDWNRITLRGKLTTTAETITAGLTIPAGQSVEVFGPQLEAQPSASPYKQTFSESGVYPNVHLREDIFSFTTTGTNRHNCTLNVTTR